ncbi:MAG: MFS transporter, partial [Verrucomicrobiota bacterium]
LKMEPNKIALLLVIFRLWDSITDPLMGNFSDNTRTKWGRRRPYMLVGAALVGVTYPFIWWGPIEGTQDQLFWWLLLTGIVFYTCFTIFNMPYQSLLLEMTPDYHERTRVTGVRGMYQTLAGFLVGWAWWLTQRPIFAMPETGEINSAYAMRYISVGMGIAFFVLAFLPALFVKERYYESSLTQTQKKVGLLKSMRETFSNKPFMILLGIAMLYVLGTTIVDGLGNYVATYHVLGGDTDAAAKWAGWGSTVYVCVGLVAIPLFSRLSERIGKNKSLMLSIGLIIAGGISVWFTYIPGEPALMLVYSAFRGVGIAGLWLMIPSMQADSVDYDELKTGERREGSFAAVFSWMLKLSMTLAVGLTGPVLNMTGYDASLGVDQAEGVITSLRMCFAFVPVAILFGCGALLCFFPLNPQRSAEIRAELEARRGTV